MLLKGDLILGPFSVLLLGLYNLKHLEVTVVIWHYIVYQSKVWTHLPVDMNESVCPNLYL